MLVLLTMSWSLQVALWRKLKDGFIHSVHAFFSTLSLHLQSLKLFVSGFQDGLRRLSGNEYIFSTKREFTKCIMQLWHRVQIFHYIFFPAWVYIIYFCTFCVFCILYCSTAWISKKKQKKTTTSSSLLPFPLHLNSSFVMSSFSSQSPTISPVTWQLLCR